MKNPQASKFKAKSESATVVHWFWGTMVCSWWHWFTWESTLLTLIVGWYLTVKNSVYEAMSFLKFYQSTTCNTGNAQIEKLKYCKSVWID